MTSTKPVVAIDTPAKTGTNYPAPFDQVVAGRLKHVLGNSFGLSNIGINLTELLPGAASALYHAHEKQDEFVYVTKGELTLIYDRVETLMTEGMCIGFPAGGAPHQLVNRSDKPAAYLEIGDRTADDVVHYPDVDLAVTMTDEGKWAFTDKSGKALT